MGDHDYKRGCLLLPNINSVNCCNRCPANNDENGTPWFDFRRCANWVLRTYARGGYDVSKCRLFDIKGVSNQSVFPDWMHDKSGGTDKVPQCLNTLSNMSYGHLLLLSLVYLFVCKSSYAYSCFLDVFTYSIYFLWCGGS